MYTERLRQVRAKSELEIPKDVQVEVIGPVVKVTGPLGTLSKDFSKMRVNIEKEGDKILVQTDIKGRRGKAMVGTVIKKISNAIRGVKVPYVVKMKLAFSHFPPTVRVQGNTLSIENFMGERTPRKVTIPPDVNVEIQGQDITLTGPDIDSVTQLAGSVETVTRTKERDQRKYLDGIYAQSKGYEDEPER